MVQVRGVSLDARANHFSHRILLSQSPDAIDSGGRSDGESLGKESLYMFGL